ncbi:glycosyltransferase family 2 protein [Latilactobacillus graminis]|uniref:Glycosyl transferase family 2 n=2 Tax=Latilactobacillus graminis TaxID=60519 RepID=A0AA89KZU8_9LACO|nr:glycosyltransferase family 2 protein [Latilactobacillus graminis]KRM21026.1 glycosyl transferase family 2 [Latilactobacillus graminis DSM 20719]QFP79161.1 glycosyltransferase [Latilactobacillus graminis]
MNSPELSIIIPAYNCGMYIRNCLDQIIQQFDTFQIKGEVIIVDDGSTDDTAEIITEYVNQVAYIKAFFQENLKQAKARNCGIKNANGKNILFLDADDTLEDNMLILLLKESRNGSFPICGIKKIYTELGISEVELPTITNTSNSGLQAYLTTNNEADVGLWNKMFNAAIIKDNNILFENSNFFEDSLFVFDYLVNSNQNIHLINKPLYNLFKRGGSTTTAFDQKIDVLAKGYIKKIINRVNKLKDVNLDKMTMDTFRIRITMHIIHHHIKYDGEWTSDKQRKIIKDSHLERFLILNRLRGKYRIAFLGMYLFPREYIKLYRR